VGAFLIGLGVGSWLEFAAEFVVKGGRVDSAEDRVDDCPKVAWLLKGALEDLLDVGHEVEIIFSGKKLL
jgi:hypothetical protein